MNGFWRNKRAFQPPALWFLVEPLGFFWVRLCKHRQASKQVVDSLQSWANEHAGAIVERLGMDEFCVDVTDAAKAYMVQGCACTLEESHREA
eukprot:5728259-Amphidinium_carterae.1